MFTTNKMNLQITGRCNYNCIHCFDAKDNSPLKTELTLNEITHLLDECVISGIKSLIITGGEPMIHPQYKEIIEAIYARGLSVFELNTNGFFIDQKMLDWMKEINFNPLIKISFDGLGFHNWMRGSSIAEEKTLDAIKLCIANGFKVKVQMNVNKKNADSILPSLNMLDQMGVVETRIIKTTNSPRWLENSENDSMSIKEYYDFCLDLLGKYLAEEKNSEKPHQMILTAWLVFRLFPKEKRFDLVPINCEADKYKEPIPLCMGVRTMIAVGSDGQVYPCMQTQGHFVKHNIDLGNVKRDGLAKILSEGPYIEMVTKTIDDRLKSDSDCKNCEHFKYCCGGCPAMAILTSGNYLLEDKTKCTFFKEGYFKKFEAIMEHWGQAPVYHIYQF